MVEMEKFYRYYIKVRSDRILIQSRLDNLRWKDNNLGFNLLLYSILATSIPTYR